MNTLYNRGFLEKLPNVIRFMIVFMIFYLTFAGLSNIKAVRLAVVPVYNVFQEVIFNMAHPTIRTDFASFKQENSINDDEFDYSVHLMSKAEYKQARDKSRVNVFVTLNQNARITALGPFIMLLALVIASPISWRRKLIAFFAGSIVIFFILAMKYTAVMDTNIEQSLAQNNFLAPLRQPDSAWINFSSFMNDAFRTNEFLSLIIIPIWAISGLKKKDWTWFMG